MQPLEATAPSWSSKGPRKALHGAMERRLDIPRQTCYHLQWKKGRELEGTYIVRTHRCTTGDRSPHATSHPMLTAGVAAAGARGLHTTTLAICRPYWKWTVAPSWCCIVTSTGAPPPPTPHPICFCFQYQKLGARAGFFFSRLLISDFSRTPPIQIHF